MPSLNGGRWVDDRFTRDYNRYVSLTLAQRERYFDRDGQCFDHKRMCCGRCSRHAALGDELAAEAQKEFWNG